MLEIVSLVDDVADVVDSNAPEPSYHSNVYVSESPSASLLCVVMVHVMSSTPSVGDVGEISTIGAEGGELLITIFVSV